MRKIIGIILVFMLILSQIPVLGFADEEVNPLADIEISTVPKRIKVGDTFNLTIIVEPKSNIEINEIGIKSSGSFVLTDSNFKKKVENGKVTFTFKYNGGSSYQIPITIYYEYVGGSQQHSYSYSIDLPNVDSEKPDPIDENKIIPRLNIANSRNLTAEAGESLRLPITIRNSGEYDAEDITVTLDVERDSPINILGTGYENITRIGDDRTEDVNFRLNIEEYAERGTYPIKINLQYYNSYGVYFDDSKTIYIKVENNNTEPFISISKVDVFPEQSQAGEITVVGFNLTNNGTLDAKDIKVSLDGISGDTFTISSGINSKYIEEIPGGKSKYVYFEIIPSFKLAGGTHELNVLLNYEDGKGGKHEDSSKFFVNVASNKDKISNLIIENLKYPEGALGQNSNVNISFNLKNIGKIDAKNIVVTVESMDQNGVVPKSVSIKKINLLNPNQSEKLDFVFLTTDNAETKNHPITITVEYEDDLSDDEKHTLTQYLGVYVVEAGEIGKPKLIIDKYDFEPNIVKAGENFSMNLSFFNTNSQQAIRNIKIFLTSNETTDPNSNTSGSSVFTPVDSSNTFYIDSIPPKGRVEKSITMFTVPDAQAKTYTLTANFEYENSEGEEFTATELIGVPVVQQSKLELGEISVPPEAFVGQPTPVYIEFYNTGKVTLYNMMVKLEGDFQTESGTYYVGNFDIGRSDYFEGMVIPQEPGELTGDLVFTYEDSAGETIEVRKDFTMNVMESMPMEEFPQDMPPIEEEDTSIFKKPIFWIIIILALGLGGFIFYKKRKKEGMALDE